MRGDVLRLGEKHNKGEGGQVILKKDKKISAHQGTRDINKISLSSPQYNGATQSNIDLQA